jgi:cell division initiation protein
MAITPQDIEQLTFSPSKHGYDTEEVDAFLENLSDEVGAMLQKIADLKGRLNKSEQQLEAAQARVEQLEAAQGSTTLAPAPQPQSQSEFSDADRERQISQALIVAQESADRIVNEAREAADKIRNDADQKAREVIRQALAEKQNELDEIDRLKQSREDFRTEYKNLLQRFMDDADAAFPNQVLNSSSKAREEHVSTYEAPKPTTTEAPSYGSDNPTTSPVGLDDLD